MTKRFKRAGSVKDNYPPGRDFLCSKCGTDLERLVKDEDGPGYRLNANGECSNCGFRNNWFAKRGFAPGEGSKNTLSTKQKRHKAKRRKRKEKKMESQKERDEVIKDIVSSHKFTDIVEMLFKANQSFECSPLAGDKSVFVVDAGPDEIYYFNREGELVDPPSDMAADTSKNNDKFKNLVSYLTKELNELGAQKSDDVSLGEELGSLVVEFSQQISELPLVQEAFADLGRVHAEQANNIIDAVKKEGGLTTDGEAVLMAGLAWLKLAKGPLE